MHDVAERQSVRVGTWERDTPVALTAGAVSALGWWTARLSGIDLAVRSGSGTQHVNVVSAIVVAMVAAFVGGMALRVLARRTDAALKVWTIVAYACLAVSLVGPLGATTLAAGLVLVGLHLMVGGVVICGLRRRYAPANGRA
jgi:hypothetical protein